MTKGVAVIRSLYPLSTEPGAHWLMAGAKVNPQWPFAVTVPPDTAWFMVAHGDLTPKATVVPSEHGTPHTYRWTVELAGIGGEANSMADGMLLCDQARAIIWESLGSRNDNMAALVAQTDLRAARAILGSSLSMDSTTCLRAVVESLDLKARALDEPVSARREGL